MNTLSGKRLLITGASSGLGAHFARLAARNGASVAIAARRRERLEALLPELRELGAPKAEAFALDVADEASIADCVGAVFETFGGLDVLVNNAGVSGGGAAIESDAAEFDSVIGVNLRGVWLMAVETARRWRDTGSGGAIVNIASILGLRVSPGVAPYSISKAGVVQMTHALALEWARFGIRVNALAPGYFETEMNEGFFDTEPGKRLISRIPMRRIGGLAEIEGPFLLLAGDQSSFMTGAVIPVDGGHLVSSL